MTGRYALSPRAQDDLVDICDYSAKRWGVDQAEFYIRRLMLHIEAVAAKPEISRRCPKMRQGYRRYVSGSLVPFYRLSGGTVELVRVLRERIDCDQHL